MKEASPETKKRNRWLKLLSAEFLVVFLLLIVAIIIFAYSVNMVFIKKTTSFDERIFNYVSGHVSPFFTDVMVFISFLGKHTFLIPANLTLLAFYIFIRKNKRLSLRISSMALTSLSLMFFLKLSFQRLRPEVPLLEKVNGFSFPSGHSLMSMTFYGSMIYIVWKEIKTIWLRNIIIVILGLLIFFIGYSRVYLRVHYASDVIAGFAVGFAWLLLASWVMDLLEKRYLTRKELASNN